MNFSNGHNQKVHMHMVDLMSSIICEGDTVSQELLDTVLVNLVPAHKVSRVYTEICLKPINLRSRPCAYVLNVIFPALALVLETLF